jgi:hypothetical protein
MELIIHGTKEGYRSCFNPNYTSKFSMSDIRNGVNTEHPLGQSAYSIAFTNEGYVYTKYIIVRDTLRNYATGFVAFSLFLLKEEELLNKGKDVKTLLDDISSIYVGKYIKDNNINSGEKTSIPEDWNLLDSVWKKYAPQKKEELETKPAGTKEPAKEPAFVYYSDDTKLQKYFDVPYQDEYAPYKQVLFVKSDLKGKPENPLNALRNSGIELKDIDLEKYKVILSYPGFDATNIELQVKINNDESKANNIIWISIKKDDHQKITYNKEHYKIKTIEEKISIFLEKYKNCITIDDTKRTIEICLKVSDLTPEKKEISLKITDSKGNSIPCPQPKISVKRNDHSNWETRGNPITFKGEDIGDYYKIKVECNGYETWLINDYCPANGDNPIKVKLNKKVQENIYGEEPTSKIKKSTIVTICICCAVVIVGACLLIFTGKEDKQPDISNRIRDYVKGDSLFGDTLDYFKGRWEQQRPEIKQPFNFWGLRKGIKADSTEYKIWNTTAQSIESAIEKRNLINQKKFTELLEKQFFNQQLVLKSAIEKVVKDSTQSIAKKLGDFDKMTLTQIADSIEKMLRPKNPINDPQPNQIENKASVNTPQKEANTAESKQGTNAQDITNEIRNYLKGDELRNSKLNEYKTETNDSALKKSIKWVETFWTLAGNNDKKVFEKLLQDIKQDKNLTNSKLKDFLEKICKDFNSFKETKGRATCSTLSELNNKVNSNSN